MKKVIMFAAAALSMLACQKENISNDRGLKLTATVEQQVEDGTRTALASNNTVVWSAGDKIKVHTNDGAFDFDLYAGAGTTNGNFESATATGTPDYAIYPASAYQSISGSNITFTLPAVQNYAENSFGNGANVAVAAITGKNMEFKNVCGVLKLTLKGTMKVSRIELVGGNNEKLNGTYTVDATAPVCNDATTEIDSEKKLTLDCGTGVYLSATPTSFYFVVPVGAFGTAGHGGFTATIYDGSGASQSLNTTDERNIISRSVIKTMPSKTIMHLPIESGYQELEYLSTENKGPYIILPIALGNDTRVFIDFQYNGTSNAQALFGSWYNDRIWHVCWYNNSWFLGLNYATEVNVITPTSIIDTRRHTMEAISGADLSCSLHYDNELLITGTAAEGTTVVNHSLFARMQNPTSVQDITYSTLRVYSYVVSNADASTIHLKLVPARRISDSVLGMYDLVSNTFFTNAGTGEFVAGPEVTD